MNDVLQIIGSVASILGVPLAFYLFLKGQAQKYANVRREIVKRISHQVGEGRKVGLFELSAIIDSLVRESKLRKGSISVNSVVEDLIAETVSSPLLESARKEQLIQELSDVHSLGKMYQIIASDENIFESFLVHIGETADGEDQTERLRQDIEQAKEKTIESSKLPELFAKVAGSLTVVVMVSSIANSVGGLDLLPRILDSEIFTSLMLGVLISVLGIGAAVALNRRGSDE